MRQLDNSRLYNAYMHGAEYVMKYKGVLNRINVFPVADGDTGNNLYATMRSILMDSKLKTSVKTTLESMADASLGGARGNSGIIFSQFLNGLSIEMAGESSISMEQFVLANKKSVEYAYSAVADPVEGTMLTVIREWADSIFDFHEKAKSFQELISHGYESIEKALARTKEQLSVLKKSGVVDSGAKGFVLFIKGFMESVVYGKKSIVMEEDDEITILENNHDEVSFRYCVEAKIKGCRDTGDLRKLLGGLGDSLIAAGNERVARVHIHTNHPEDVFEILSSHEEILHQKVEDMKLQSEIISDRKYDIAVVTDSIADLPEEFIDENQITVVPLNIIMKGTEFLDKLTIGNKAVIKHIESSSEFPTTSQPDVKRLVNVLGQLLEHYESIIVITVASALSGTNNAFHKAVSVLDNKNKKISVIDSRTNSSAEGMLVQKGIDYIKKGFTHDTAVEKLKEDSHNARILVSLHTLTNMIKGGRLSTRMGKFAEKLNLKPIVTLDENGKGTLGGAAFSAEGSSRKILRKLKSLRDKDRLEAYNLVYVDDRTRAEELAGRIEEAVGMKPDFICRSSSIIAISAGSGAVAVSYMTK